MNFKLITADDINAELKNQFNTPVFENDDGELFYNEWKSVQSELKSVLERLGFRSWNDGGEDYTIVDDWGQSRHQAIEINNKSMLSSVLITTLHQTLNDFKYAYQILIEHDLYVEFDIPYCSLLLRRHEVLVQGGNSKLFKTLKILF